MTLPEDHGLKTELLNARQLTAYRKQLVIEALRGMRIEDLHQLVAEIERQLYGDTIGHA